MTTPTPMSLEQQIASLSAAVECYQAEYHNKRRELEDSNEAYALLFKAHGALQRDLAAAQEARRSAEKVLKQFFLNNSPWPDVESRKDMQSFVDEMTTEEIGRWGKAHPHHLCAALLVRAQRAEERAAACENDAQRYRWLRNPTLPVAIWINNELPFAVDTVIDAAIAARAK